MVFSIDVSMFSMASFMLLLLLLLVLVVIGSGSSSQCSWNDRVYYAQTTRRADVVHVASKIIISWSLYSKTCLAMVRIPTVLFATLAWTSCQEEGLDEGRRCYWVQAT